MTDISQAIAGDIKKAREEKGRSIEEIAEELKIRARHLQAIEDGRFEDLPPPAYTAGFIRAYSTELGLDGQSLANQYRSSVGKAENKPELNFPEPVAESRIPGRALTISAALAVLAIYFGWVADFGNSAPPKRNVERVPDRLASLESGTTNSEAFGVQSAALRTETASGDWVRYITQLSGFRLDDADAATVRSASQTGAYSADNANVSANPHAEDIPLQSVELMAKSEVWVQISDNAGHEVWSGVLRSGDRWTPDADMQSDLRLMAGDAGALHIMIAGDDLGPLGKTGDVIRNLALDPKVLKNKDQLAMR